MVKRVAFNPFQRRGKVDGLKTGVVESTRADSTDSGGQDDLRQMLHFRAERIRYSGGAVCEGECLHPASGKRCSIQRITARIRASKRCRNCQLPDAGTVVKDPVSETLDACGQGQALQTGIGKGIVSDFREGTGQIDLMDIAASVEGVGAQAGQPFRQGNIGDLQMIPGRFCHGAVAGHHQFAVPVMNIGQVRTAVSLIQHNPLPVSIQRRVASERIDIR